MPPVFCVVGSRKGGGGESGESSEVVDGECWSFPFVFVAGSETTEDLGVPPVER